MAIRRLLGCLPVAALVLCTWTACKDKGDGQTGAVDLDQRCQKLAAACGDQDKHVAKMVEECAQAIRPQLDNPCADKALAIYGCYEAELCGKGDKVWSLDDLRVLAERHGKCVAERDALRECLGK
jgi:hypothetical protein